MGYLVMGELAVTSHPAISIRMNSALHHYFMQNARCTAIESLRQFYVRMTYLPFEHNYTTSFKLLVHVVHNISWFVLVIVHRSKPEETDLQSDVV